GAEVKQRAIEDRRRREAPDRDRVRLLVRLQRRRPELQRRRRPPLTRERLARRACASEDLLRSLEIDPMTDVEGAVDPARAGPDPKIVEAGHEARSLTDP